MFLNEDTKDKQAETKNQLYRVPCWKIPVCVCVWVLRLRGFSHRVCCLFQRLEGETLRSIEILQYYR